MPQGQLTKHQRAKGAVAIRAYWAQMTPAERSREMTRRRLLGAQRKRAKKGHPFASTAHIPHVNGAVPSGDSERVSIRERLLQIENAVAALKADLGL